jgi:hypothetical protein
MKLKCKNFTSAVKIFGFGPGEDLNSKNECAGLLLPAEPEIEVRQRVVRLVLHDVHVHALCLGEVVHHHEGTATGWAQNDVKCSAFSAPAEIGIVTQVIWLKLQQSLKHINSSGVLLHVVPAPQLRKNAALCKGLHLQSGT